MLTPVVVLSSIGAAAAVGLGIAARVFHVDEDPRIQDVLGLLPGANCGGCGLAGCAACAEAVVQGKVEANACVVGGTETAQQIAEHLGIALADTEPRIALPDCQGGDRATRKFDYAGLQDCRAAMLFYHGQTSCPHGCLGLGTCVRSCKFGAIEMGEDGLPHFHPDRCMGCGECVRACPKGIITLISEKAKILHWNQYTECLAPCRQRCPAQVNIPKYIQHVARGEYAEALLTIKERNPLPLSTGRVCPEPCALACRRTLGDEPVAINHLKRFVADWEMESGHRLPIPVASDTGKRVAVIGGGPGGLSAAYYLRRLGHGVSIFEREPALGGMLRYGIPEYRLPKQILDWELEGILELGVEATCGVEFGKDFTLDFLAAEGFDAVFLAVGAWNEHALGIEGSDLEGVQSGIAFLERFQGEDPVPIGDRVVVVGGGNTAIDAARSALRQGAREVTIVYRRSRDEMPANPAEIVAAEEEGIRFRFLAAPHRVMGQNGKVNALEIQGMELGEPDPSGRRRPVPIEGDLSVVSCETIVEAVGQYPDLDFMEPAGVGDLERTRWKTIEADESTLQTALPQVFTGGDCFTGPGLMVEAIAAGRYAARSIHFYLTDGEIPPIEDRQTGFIEESLHRTIAGVRRSGRQHEPVIPLEQRLGSFREVEGTLREEQARADAARCLNCGVFCYDHEAEMQRQAEAGRTPVS